MTTAFAIHAIHQNGEVKAPGSILDLTEAEFAELEALGAVRAANEDEVALAALLAPQAEEPAAPTKVDPMDALRERAEALGIKVRKNATEESLLKAITEAEKAQATADGQADPDETDLLNP